MMKELKGAVTAGDVRALVEQMRTVVDRYGWGDMEVMPWASVPMKVTKIIDDIADYDRCTRDTKDYLIDFANGLVRILNAWVEHEQNSVVVRLLDTGKTVRVERDFAEQLVGAGLCEIL